jgi:integrase
MASFNKRRNGDGSTSWDAMVRIVGYPSRTKSFRSKLAAELWAARTESAAKGGTLASANGMTLGLLLDEALPRLTNPSVAAFAYWREHMGDLRLEKITPELIASHRDLLLGADCRGHNHKTSKPRSSATVRNYIIELGRLFALAVKELRVMEANPVTRVTKPKGSAEVVRFLSDEERTALLAMCKTSDQPDLYAFVLFALTTGARKGEVSNLEWAQVDLARRWAIFPRTKNGDSRGVPLTNTVCALLTARLAERKPLVAPYTPAQQSLWMRVFPVDITKAWHGAIKRAKVENFRFHDLRHSCASAMAQAGANLPDIATLLGHKGLAMTLRYSHISNAGTSRLVDRVMGDIA